MAGSVEWALPSTSWDEAEALIGTELGRFAGADEVTLGGIRRRLEVLAWDCPLHYDEAVAKAHGYRTVVSPASMYMTWAMPRYWEPGMPRPTSPQHRYMPRLPMVMNLPGEGDGLLDTDFEAEYHAPVYPGDRISAVSRIVGITRKRTSLGAGAFLVVESTFTNQTGAVVAVDRVTLFRYHPEGGPMATRPAGRPDEVSVGAEITPYTLPLTVQLLVMEAAANRDLSPIHHDNAVARELGAPDMFVGVLFLQALYEAVAREWIGFAGRIESIKFRMRTFNCPGDVLTCRARVRTKRRESSYWRVAVDAWTESQRGITTEGEVVVHIPW
jgi:acyl dehydratase